MSHRSSHQYRLPLTAPASPFQEPLHFQQNGCPFLQSLLQYPASDEYRRTGIHLSTDILRCSAQEKSHPLTPQSAVPVTYRSACSCIQDQPLPFPP